MAQLPRSRSQRLVDAFFFTAIRLMLQGILAADSLSSAIYNFPGAGGKTINPCCERVSVGTLSISPLCFGTLNLPCAKEDSNAIETTKLFSALPTGTLIDTAEIYGAGKNGKTEKNVGDAVRKARLRVGHTTSNDDRSAHFIGTKFAPQLWRRTSDSVVSACQASGKRLGVSSIDLYQIHFPDRGIYGFMTNDEGFWDGLADCYHSGMVANVGVCNYGPTMIRRCHAALSERGVPLVSNQINYNLMRYRSSRDTKDVCDELGITVLGYHPLGNGVLTGKYNEDYCNDILRGGGGDFASGKSKARRMKWYLKNTVPLLGELRKISNARDKTCAQVAVNWSICKGVLPICGAQTVDQALDLVDSLGWSLTVDEVSRLDLASNASAEYAKGFDLI